MKKKDRLNQKKKDVNNCRTNFVVKLKICRANSNGKNK